MNRKTILAAGTMILLTGAIHAQMPGDAPPPIPPNDDDIDRIIYKTEASKDLAQQCSSTECPDFDCESAQKVSIRLWDAREYMRHTHFWLSRASETAAEHFLSLHEQGMLTTKRLAKVQTIVAYQEYVTNIAGIMLDIASASVNLKDLSQNAKKLEEMTGPELLDNLDTLYEGMKDFESADKAVKSGVKAEDESETSLFGLGSDEIDFAKSTFSDLKTIVEKAYEDGGNWRNAFKSKGGRAAVGAIIGRIAKAYAESEIKERKQLIKGLEDNLRAEDYAQSGNATFYQRIVTRRIKAETALSTLDNLLVIGSGSPGGSLTRCFLKRKNFCTDFDFNYASEISFPDKYQIYDVRVPNDETRYWGEALKYFNGKLPEVEKLLSVSLQINESRAPELQLEKTTFKPDEGIKAKFMAPVCYPHRSWVGIVPSAIPHGDVQLNNNEQLGGASYLRHRTRGEMSFGAPSEPGNYDLRMNNTDTGREVVSTAFTVQEDMESRDLNGIWKVGDGGTVIELIQKGSSVYTNYDDYKESTDSTNITLYGEFNGRTFSGTISMMYMYGYRQRCNEEWRTINDLRYDSDHGAFLQDFARTGITLTLSKDGNKLLHGKYQRPSDEDNCIIRPAVWENIELERTNSPQSTN